MKRDYVTSTTRENMYQNNITYRRNIDHTSFVLRGVFGVGLTGCEMKEVSYLWQDGYWIVEAMDWNGMHSVDRCLFKKSSS
jgi:hypothetical protein